MAQRAVRPNDDAVAEEIHTISDDEWEAMLREQGARVRELTDEEARAIFDARARRNMGMSGEVFLRRYDAGEFDDIPDDADHLDYWHLVMSIPLGR